MFIIYAMYDRDSAEKLIDLYFSDGCDKATRLKIYCYIAVSGLVWSNWCEFKRHCGVEFGAYAQRQYDYAREYTKIFFKEYREAFGRDYRLEKMSICLTQTSTLATVFWFLLEIM